MTLLYALTNWAELRAKGLHHTLAARPDAYLTVEDVRWLPEVRHWSAEILDKTLDELFAAGLAWQDNLGRLCVAPLETA